MSTNIQFVDRDEVVATIPKTENAITLREDAIANDKGIAQLLSEIAEARRDLKLSARHLAALEESLAGKTTVEK